MSAKPKVMAPLKLILLTIVLSVIGYIGIYRKWFADNKKTGFKDLKFPLSDSSFDWLGGDKDLNNYLKQSL